MERDSEGHRTYTISHRVKVDPLDGPAVALTTPGLPLPGSPWLVDNEIDLWAWCRPNATVTPVVENEPNEYFDVVQTFSTKPPDRGSRNANNQRCHDGQIEDPLLEPQKISGSFTKYTEEAYMDRFGHPILNSAFELMRGSQVEFDHNRWTITIEQNVTNLQLDIVSLMKDCVNSVPMWGLGRRQVRLVDFNWEKRIHGLCSVYYMRKFTFEVREESHDKLLLDVGTKVLNGAWTPEGAWELIPINGTDPKRTNPNHFIRFRDKNGDFSKVVLNGRGEPADALVLTQKAGYYISIQDTNLGNKVSNGDYWVRLKNTTPVDFDENTVYQRGHLVRSPSGSTFVAVQRSDIEGGEYIITGLTIEAIELAEAFNQVPPEGAYTFFGTVPDLDGNTWVEVGALLDPYYAGIWTDSVNYPTGYYVRPSKTTRAGSIPVEKYNEVNFFLLGIPVILA